MKFKSNKYLSRKKTSNTRKSKRKIQKQKGGSNPPTALKYKKKILVSGLPEEDLDLDLDEVVYDEIFGRHPNIKIINMAKTFLTETQFKYFAEENRVNPGIENDVKRISCQGVSPLVLSTLEEMKESKNQEIISINLHGKLMKEPVQYKVPHNVILCQLSNLNTLNYILENQKFSIDKFLYRITYEQFRSLFQYRTLHSKPDNFKNLNENVIKASYNINHMIECLKKANWYFPHQMYYNIELTGDDDVTSLKQFYFDKKKKLNKKKTLFKTGDKTSLRRLMEEFSTSFPDKTFIFFNNSCQPFFYDRGKQDEEEKILNQLFIYTTIIYRLNLEIDTSLNPKSKGFKELSAKGNTPFCQDINSRIASVYNSGDFEHNYYLTVRKTHNKTDNLHRTFPFLFHMEEQMKTKKLTKKDIQRFTAFFLGLSLNKKIKYYFRIAQEIEIEIETPASGRAKKKKVSLLEKNFEALMKKVSEDKYFILNALQLYEGLDKTYRYTYANSPDSIESIIDSDIEELLFLINLIFVPRGLEQAYSIQIKRRVAKTLLGKYEEDAEFFFKEIRFPATPNLTVKKFKLLKTKINNETGINSMKAFPNMEEIEFRRIQIQPGISGVTYEVNPKLNKIDIRFITDPLIKFKFYQIPGSYVGLRYLFLEDCAIQDGLILTDTPLEILNIKKVKNLKVLQLKKLNKLQELDIHLVEPCVLVFDDVKVNKFDIECSDEATLDLNYNLNWNFKGFHINRIYIKDHLIMGLFLRDIISTAVPINLINYQSFLGDTLKPEERGQNDTKVISSLQRFIVDSSCFGLNTTFTLQKMLNYKISKGLPKFIIDGKQIKELYFKIC